MKKFWLVLLAAILAAGLVFVGCGDGEDDNGGEPGDLPTAATIYLGNGATGDLAAGFEVGGSAYQELVIVFNKNITGHEVEVAYTMEVNANVSPASTTLIPFTAGNTWGQGPRTPIYGQASPIKFTSTVAQTDIIKVTRSNAAVSTLSALFIKVGGETMTLTVADIDWDEFQENWDGPVAEFECFCEDPECPCEPEGADCEGPDCPACQEKVFIDLKIDGTAATAEIKAFEGVIEVIEGGYQVELEKGWGNAYAQFKVNFGSGKLSDFSAVTCTFQGVDGDIAYKSVYLAASATEFSNWQGFNEDNLGEVSYSNNGDIPIPMNFTIDATKAAELDAASEVWVVIQLHANPATYKVTDINFVK